MKVFKAIVVLVLIVILVLGGAIVFGMTKLDSIAKSVIEQGSTQALGVSTTLRKADVQIANQALQLDGLKVANPSGFKTDHFLTMDTGGVSVDVAKLLQDKVADIPLLTLTTIDVNLEKVSGKSNYGIILDNAQRGGSGSSSKGSEYKYVIRRLEIKNVSAHANLIPLAGDAAKVDVVVPEIVMTDVGTAGKPLTTEELVNLITKTVLASIISVGGNKLPTEILDGLQSSLASLTSVSDVSTQILDQSGQIIGNLGGVIDGAAKDLKEGADKLQKEADKIGGTVKDLLGGGKDK